MWKGDAVEATIHLKQELLPPTCLLDTKPEHVSICDDFDSHESHLLILSHGRANGFSLSVMGVLLQHYRWAGAT